jgi:hypothetical protein
VVFRADAAFAKPEIYEALESRGVKYAMRIPAHENLERDVAELLPRPVGRPSHKPIVWCKSLLYKAASWTTARRVVAKVAPGAPALDLADMAWRRVRHEGQAVARDEYHHRQRRPGGRAARDSYPSEQLILFYRCV